MLKCIYMSTKTLDTPSNLSSPTTKYLRKAGWQQETNSLLGIITVQNLTAFSTQQHNFARVFRDGTTVGIGGYYSAYRPTNYIPNIDGKLYGGTMDGVHYQIQGIDPFTGNLTGDKYFSGQYYSNFSLNGCVDIANNTGYSANGSTIRVVDLTDDSIIRTFSVSGLDTTSHLYWTRDNYILSVDYGDDSIRVFTPEDGTLKLTSSVPTTWRIAGFDKINNLLMLIHSDKKIGLYLLESGPGNLSAVTRDHATVGAGQGENFYVTLTGDGGDPIPDYWVRWSLSPVLGSLSREYSKTNSAGVATILYYPPTTAGDTVTLTAEVTL